MSQFLLALFCLFLEYTMIVNMKVVMAMNRMTHTIGSWCAMVRVNTWLTSEHLKFAK